VMDARPMRQIHRATLLALVAAAGSAGCQRKERASASPPELEPIRPPAAGAEASRTPPPLPARLPGVRTILDATIAKASRAAIGDLDGDGRNEIVVADAARLRVLDAAGQERASTSAPGGIQVLAVARLGGDRRAEIVAGWGQTREHMQAAARVEVYRLDGDQLATETIVAPQTTRNEIAAIVPFTDEPGTLLIAYFDSKYTVHGVIARRGPPWSLTELATIRMATSYARGDLDGDGRPELVVGRIYGDDQGQDGGAFVLRDGGERTPLPTTRGVRELAIADTDGDGQPELFLADGWNQDYGKVARGLLTWIHREGGQLRSDRIEDTPGQFTVGKILPADVDGDGRPELVTVGSHYVRMYARRSGRWEALTLSGVARDVAAGDLDGLPGDELLILGARAEIVSLRPR